MPRPVHHLVPPVYPILASLSEVVVRDERQHLGPGLFAAQDVHISQKSSLSAASRILTATVLKIGADLGTRAAAPHVIVVRHVNIKH